LSFDEFYVTQLLNVWLNLAESVPCSGLTWKGRFYCGLRGISRCWLYTYETRLFDEDGRGARAKKAKGEKAGEALASVWERRSLIGFALTQTREAGNSW